MILTENLDVGYGERIVISKVHIDAVRGQVICLLGPNGAGKSTILRTLAGLLAPVNGTVYIEGTDISKVKKKRLAKTVSLVLAESLNPTLTTVWDLVSMGRTPYTDFLGRLADEDNKIIAEALETVGALQLKDRMYSELSDGEKQKVMIARALVQQPQLIILDEPTSHLDIKHKIEVIRVLQQLANEKGITCILSLHDIDLALKGCQTLLLVHNGEIVSQGSPEDVLCGGIIQSLYGIENAHYDELLGLVEMQGSAAKDAFIVAGGGTGIRLYRALTRKGYGLVSGVLHENDQDCSIAKMICNTVIEEAAFEAISSDTLDKAEQEMLQAKCVIDSGFTVGTINADNLQLINRAVKTGKPVLSMRTPEECRHYYGKLSEKIYCISSIKELLEGIENFI